MSVYLVKSFLFTHHSSSRLEQSKQYLQVRWRAHRRRRNGCSKSMVLIQIGSSAARSRVSLCSLIPQIFMGSSFSPKCDLKTRWCGAKKKWELIKFPCRMLCGMELLQAGATSKESSPAFLFLLRETQWLECVDRPELTPVKCLSSLQPLKRRTFKGINHLLSQGEGV